MANPGTPASMVVENDQSDPERWALKTASPSASPVGRRRL
jgi:hypothetical protein